MREALTFGPGQQRHLPIVTGFLGRGLQTGAITTLGRGGSDLTCTLLGAALGLPEVQVRAGARAGLGTADATARRGAFVGSSSLCGPLKPGGPTGCGMARAQPAVRCSGRSRPSAGPGAHPSVRALAPPPPCRCGRTWTGC